MSSLTSFNPINNQWIILFCHTNVEQLTVSTSSCPPVTSNFHVSKYVIATSNNSISIPQCPTIRELRVSKNRIVLVITSIGMIVYCWVTRHWVNTEDIVCLIKYIPQLHTLNGQNLIDDEFIPWLKDFSPSIYTVTTDPSMVRLIRLLFWK